VREGLEEEDRGVESGPCRTRADPGAIGLREAEVDTGVEGIEAPVDDLVDSLVPARERYKEVALAEVVGDAGISGDKTLKSLINTSP
jgi:hypothetical protein